MLFILNEDSLYKVRKLIDRITLLLEYKESENEDKVSKIDNTFKRIIDMINSEYESSLEKTIIIEKQMGKVNMSLEDYPHLEDIVFSINRLSDSLYNMVNRMKIETLEDTEIVYGKLLIIIQHLNGDKFSLLRRYLFKICSPLDTNPIGFLSSGISSPEESEDFVNKISFLTRMINRM